MKIELLHEFFLLPHKEEKDLFLKQNYISRREISTILLLGYLQVLEFETIPILIRDKSIENLDFFSSYIKEMYEKKLKVKWEGVIVGDQIVFKNNTNTLKFYLYGKNKPLLEGEVKPILF